MNTAQITHLLQANPFTRDVFLGVYPRDRLPRSVDKNRPRAYVCNTAPHQEEGEHWVAIYIDEHGCGEYFDSYGLPPLHPSFVNFLNKQSINWTYNDKQLQGLTTSVCGHFCIGYSIYFIAAMVYQ
jgi:hypothetical protein